MADSSAKNDWDQLSPELLDEKNKILSQQTKEKESLLNVKRKEIEEQNERLNVMQEHLKNVKSEVFRTQQRLEVKQREIETEQHMYQIAEREIGRLRSEMVHFEKEGAEIQERMDAMQNSIFRANENIDKFKMQMNFNKEDLEQWTLAQKQKEDDILALERYQRADEAKIKELTLQIEKLTKKMHTKKHELEFEITETQASQIELDKAAEDFTRLHKERRDLVQQWEEAIEAMKRRDDAIRAAGERFAEGKAVIRMKQELLSKEAEFLENEKQNNHELNAKITNADRVVAKYRDEFSVAKNAITEIEDEVEVIKNTLAKATTELTNKRLQNENLRLEQKEKQLKAERTERQKAHVKTKLESEFKLAGDLEKKSSQVDELLLQTENRLKAVDKELSELKQAQYKQSQELFAVRKQEANLIAEISGANSQNKNMQSKIQQMDAEAFKQQELLYNIEFKIQQMERKVSRASGERTEEEQKALKAKIEELQAKLDIHQKNHSMLQSQLKRVNDEVRQTKRVVEAKKNEKEKLSEKIMELNLENESRELEIKQTVTRKEELMVQHDVLKLHAKRLRDLLKNRADEVFGLENRKFQLEMTLQQKEKEIKLHKEVLRAEMKNVEDERRKLALELKDREQTVNKLKTRYTIMLKKLQPEETEEEMTQAQYLIKAIQEREELQRKGDLLDMEIQKLEKEDKALEKTLMLLKDRNHVYQQHFKRVNESDSDYQTKMLLEQKSKELDVVINRRNQEMKEIYEAAMHRKTELDEVIQERHEHETHAAQMGENRNHLHRDVQDAQANSDKYKKMLNKCIKDFRKKTNSEAVTNEEREIYIQDLREKNSQVLFSIAQIAQSSPEMAATLDRLLNAFQLKLPSRPPSSRLQSGHEAPGSRSGRSSSSRGATPGLSSSRVNSASGFRTASANSARTSSPIVYSNVANSSNVNVRSSSANNLNASIASNASVRSTGSAGSNGSNGSASGVTTPGVLVKPRTVSLNL